jgi:hemerythrin-like domain-containing protein
MKATAILVHEHDVILQALAVLDGMAARLVGGGSVTAPDVEQLLEFFVVFADRCHHAKEEGILFPALEAAGVPRAGGPIGVMLDEHEVGRRLVGRLRQDGAAAAGGDAAAQRRFAEAAHEYVALLEQHIAKENQVLFPAADGMLTDEDDRAITAAFERHEELEMGPGVHERFHRMLDDLAARYR